MQATCAGPQEGGQYAFTDIKFDRINQSLVVSGTSINPNFDIAGAVLREQDAFLMRTRLDGSVVWSWDYDFPFDLEGVRRDCSARRSRKGISVPFCQAASKATLASASTSLDLVNRFSSKFPSLAPVKFALPPM